MRTNDTWIGFQTLRYRSICISLALALSALLLTSVNLRNGVLFGILAMWPVINNAFIVWFARARAQQFLQLNAEHITATSHGSTLVSEEVARSVPWAENRLSFAPIVCYSFPWLLPMVLLLFLIRPHSKMYSQLVFSKAGLGTIAMTIFAFHDSAVFLYVTIGLLYVADFGARSAFSGSDDILLVGCLLAALVLVRLTYVRRRMMKSGENL